MKMISYHARLIVSFFTGWKATFRLAFVFKA